MWVSERFTARAGKDHLPFHVAVLSRSLGDDASVDARKNALSR